MAEAQQLCRLMVRAAGMGAGRGSAGMGHEETKEGEYEVMEWPAPSPLFIGQMRQPKSPQPLFFAIIVNLGLARIIICNSKFLT